MHMAEKNARGGQDKILSEASQEKTRTSGRGKRVQDLLAERSCCRLWDMGDKERGYHVHMMSAQGGGEGGTPQADA